MKYTHTFNFRPPKIHKRFYDLWRTIVPTGYSKATALHDDSSSKIDILNCNENFIRYRIIMTYFKLRSSR